MRSILACRGSIALAAALAIAPAALAQDEVQQFNAFAWVQATGTAVKSGGDRATTVGVLEGPYFIETDEGPQHAGRVVCTAAARVELKSTKQVATGACTFTATDGAVAWGEWECEGYSLVGCRGAFKLGGGTGRLAGASGEAVTIWRPDAQALRKQLEGATVQTSTGVILWREFKLSQKK